MQYPIGYKSMIIIMFQIMMFKKKSKSIHHKKSNRNAKKYKNYKLYYNILELYFNKYLFK